MRNFLIILSITLGIILGLEAILQVNYFLNSSDKTEGDDITAFRFNDDYLIELVPNTTKLFVRSEQNGGDSIIWRVNSDGFRGDELRIDPELRIMVYGDSNIQARFSEEESTFVYKLGSYLRDYTSKDIEVINAGVVGFGPDQSLLKFESEIDVYKPDLIVVNLFGFNDFGDVIRNRLFEIDTDLKLRKTAFDRKPDSELKKDKDFKIRIWEWAQSIRKKIDEDKRAKENGEWSPDFQEGVANYFIKANQDAFQVYKEGKPQEYSHFDDAYDIDVSTDSDSESSKVKLLLLEEILKRFKTVSESNDVEMVLLFQPSLTDLTNSNYYIGFEYLQSHFSNYERDLVADSVSEIGNKLELNYIDLYDVFLKNNPEELYFKGGNTHWNDSGQDLAARETALFILDSLGVDELAPN